MADLLALCRDEWPALRWRRVMDRLGVCAVGSDRHGDLIRVDYHQIERMCRGSVRDYWSQPDNVGRYGSVRGALRAYRHRT